jgi:flagellar assembly factor FliW
MSDQTGELPIIEFVAPIPGFPEHRRFVLTTVDERGLLYALRAIDGPDLRFLVVAPAPFFPDYAPVVDDGTLALLQAGGDPDRLLVLLVVSAPDSAARATANLLAPIVVDRLTRRAAQVVQAGSSLPIRAPLVAV